MMSPNVGMADHRYRYCFRSPLGVAGNGNGNALRFRERFPTVYAPFPLA